MSKKKKVETNRFKQIIEGRILPLSSIRPQVSSRSAEIVWKSAACERHKAEIYSALRVWFTVLIAVC